MSLSRNKSVPIAIAPVESTAIAASPCMRRFSVSHIKTNAASITIGSETAIEAFPTCSTVAIAKAPKPTWLKPSPIMEYRFSTSVTPSKLAHSDTSVPTTSARVMISGIF